MGHSMANSSVLIIDDEQSVRDAVVDSLKREGYDIFQAENGEEGLSLVHSLHPTVIILDLKMPDMDGLNFLINLKSSSSVTSSVIVLSGHGDPDGRRECYGMGINIFLRKPFDIYEIRGVVRNAVALQHLTNRVQALTVLKELLQKTLAQADEQNPSILREIDRSVGEISPSDDKLGDQGEC